MRAAEMTPDQLTEAHEAAEVLTSEKFRPYLSSRVLPPLVTRFRDDAARALGMALPPLPQRHPVSAMKLEALTSTELDALTGAVVTLATRFTALMDDPVLPERLRDLRDLLTTEKAERARIAEEIREKAGAS
jgi:hypothetical protein